MTKKRTDVTISSAGVRPGSQAETTTARVSRDKHRRAKVYAAQNDLDVQEVLDAALDEYLKKRGA